ncbi:uncharacterized protein KGF55_002142 [Candida pseudojiufengensis]|uniref:uncharacterized protein n=1 Tax=Candida pseudojiufengensis TaxID=497109 RepID=UPI00222540AF|nr:uncharacterized protein KGF55_002142 [Candida pseudojiufengensis]KAI5964200.1 hypothetical protein KGF55_002142 [Candida pseudojiufengensis]
MAAFIQNESESNPNNEQILQSVHLSPHKTLNKNDNNNNNTHQRNESSYSRNFSLLDCYEAESPSQRDSYVEINSIDHDEINAQINGLNISHTPSNKGSSNNFDESDGTIRLDQKSSLNTNGTSRRSYIKPTTSISDKHILKSKFDRYGFKKVSSQSTITINEYNKWFAEYSEYSIRRKRKWEILLKNNGLLYKSSEIDSIDQNVVPTRFPPKSDKVKKLVRKGIPPEWRGNAWFYYAGGNEKLSNSNITYDQLVEVTQDIKNKDTEIIERDLFRTFPDNIYFNSSILKDDQDKYTSSASSLANSATNEREETELIKSLRRVLVAFAHYQPQIGYCQSLNFLAGLLLLFMNEEKSFWMLVILTERIIPKVHSANLEGVHTDQGVLMLCVKEYIPDLWDILGTNFEGEKLKEDKILTRLPPVTLVTSSWFMSLFVGILPIETVLRVWDILFYENSKTIFRISLTIFKLCLDSPEFQASNKGGEENEQIELFQFTQNFPKKLLDPNNLIDHCFKKIGGYGFGSLSQDEINKCRTFVAKQREKMKSNKLKDLTGMTEEERKTLSSSALYDEDLNGEDNIHDIYGFHRPIMSGIVWNKSISDKVRKRFSGKKRT